jgi:oxygen-independent coproporphyrinogen-3 oxidase
LEEGTPFYSRYKSGKLELPSWADNRAMYHAAVDLLKEKGYEHYEVSAAALPGRRCRHNLKYWSMEEYLGLGLAAHSYLEDIRYENTSDLAGYLSGSYCVNTEPGTEEERMGDYLFTELRRIGGFEYSDFALRFGKDFQAVYGAPVSALVREGLLLCDGDTLRFSPEGLDRNNDVISRLLNHEREIHEQ